MRKKYLLGICLFILLMSMTGISASENVNQTDSLGLSIEDNFETAENDQEIIRSTDNEVELKENENTTEYSNILGISNEDEILGKPINTFESISNAINGAQAGDIIHLNGTYYNNDYGHITINKEISIIGEDNTILDADDSVTVEENEKSDVFEASGPGDIQSGDVAAQDDVLMSKRGDVLGVAPEDVLGVEEVIIMVTITNGPNLITFDFIIRFIKVSGSTYNYQLHYISSSENTLVDDVTLVGTSSISIASGISVGDIVSFSLPNRPYGEYKLRVKYELRIGTSRSFELPDPDPEKDTVTSISSSSITYNSGNFSVSGTVKDTNGNAVNEGTVTVKIGSTAKTAMVTGGSWQTPVEFSSTAYGMTSQTINATYSGISGLYKTSSETGTLTINKNTPTIVINDIAVVTYNGDSYSISGTAQPSGGKGLTSGTITLKTDTGVTLSGNTSWSSGTWYVTGISSALLAPETYTVTATYSANDYYNEASSQDTSLTVNKMTPAVIVTGNPNFKYNINLGQIINGYISNSLDGEYVGYVNITIGDVLVKSNLAVSTDGTWSFTNYDTGAFLPNRTPYTITVSYGGNEYNDAASGTGTYTVNWGDSIPIVVSDGDINVGDNKTVKVTVRDSKGFVQGSTVVLNGTGLPDTGLSLKTGSDGNVVFNVSGLAKGYYDDWMVIPQEDERYISLFNQTVEPFYVKDALNIIITNVESYQSTYPESIVITGKTNVDDNSVGSINLTLGDKTVNAPLNDSVFTATFTDVIPSKYATLTAVFILDDSDHWYGGHVQDVQLAEEVIIDKFSPVIDISNVQLTKNLYPGNVTISFRIIGAENGRLPTGRVEAIFEGRLANEVFIDSIDVYTIDVDNLPEGSFNITLKYLGDDYYSQNTNDTHDITILPNSELSFIDNYYDVVSPAIVNVSSNMNGRSLMVYLDGNYYGDITVQNDKSLIDLGILTAGNHILTLRFEGDESFTKIYESHRIFVDKLNSTVNVTATSVRTGNSVIVDVNASGNGIATTIIFNGADVLGTFNIAINGGKGSYIVPIDFVEGDYDLNITYAGDEIYYSNANDTSFTVTDRIISEITFTEPELYIVNSTSTIDITTNFPTGILNVLVDGKKVNSISVDNYNAKLILDSLSAGNHNILVSYGGDYDYTGASNNLTINVIKYDSILGVKINNPLYVDDLVDITITVNESAGGYVIVNLNNKDYRVKINNHVAKLNLTGLAYATYTVSVSYLGDDYYNPKNTSEEFTIYRYVSLIDIGDITLGDALQVNITSADGYNPAEVTGKFNITIGTVTLNNLFVAYGKVIIPADKLPGLPGAYHVAANYSGNYKFLPFDITTGININKLPSPLINEVYNVTIGDDLNITLTGDDRYVIDGNVTVKIDGGEPFILPVNDGVVTISSDRLPQAESSYNITIGYADATYYKDTSAEWVLHSDKITDYVFTISGDIISFKENATLTVTLPSDATGFITIGNEIIPVKNGVASAVLANLPVGTTDVPVTYSGDDKYNSIETSVVVTVIDKYDPLKENLTISAVADSIAVGEDAIIVVSGLKDATGTVTAAVGGKTYVAPILGGSASVIVHGLAENVTATVFYAGDENYNPASTAVNITVNPAPQPVRKNLTMHANAEPITVGEDAVVIVAGLESATGDVSVIVNGKTYTAPIKKGEARITVSGLKENAAGKVSYHGDDNYNDAHTTVVIIVDSLPDPGKKNLTIKASAEPIIVGENAIVKVTGLESAAGDVSVTVDGKLYSASIKNGEATVTVSGINENVTAYVNYVGDENYNPASTAVKITVNPKGKENATISIDAPEITEGENATVTVTLPDDATGSVTIGNGVVLVVNGTASAVLTNLPLGNTTVPVTYSGDDKYNPIETEVNINVKKDTSDIIKAPDVSKYCGGFERFVVSVTDYKSNPLANKSVVILINGVKYTRTTNANGTCSIALNLPADVYNVTTTVDNATTNSVVTILTTVNGTDLVKVFRNATQYYATFRDTNGKYLAEGTVVRFNINGVMYDRKVTANGLAKLNINLEQGKYIITAINLATGEMSSNNITVIPRIIENNDLTKYYRNASQYTVKIIGDDGKAVGAGTTVTFNINGVMYMRQTNASGIVKLNINLEAGDYIITAEYNGCRVSNNIKVLSVLTANDMVKKYGTSDQFVATLVDGQGKPYAGQTVQFNVNGVFYNRVTDSDGQTKLNIRLMAGQYIITSGYNGCNISNKITISA